MSFRAFSFPPDILLFCSPKPTFCYRRHCFLLVFGVAMVVRLGIIGLSADQAAWATLAHVQALKPGGSLADQYKLTALATSNPESAKAAAKAHGLPPEKAYSSPEDIANDPEVDMVVVSVKVSFQHRLMLLLDPADWCRFLCIRN